MKVLLIDADSKISNIALMKLSTYYKNSGDTVDFIRLDGKSFEYKDTHDLAFGSIIFSKNKDNIQGNVKLGGTGVSLETTLPADVEHLFPDYSLYPENDYSIGFLTRGCCRNCSFCIVPKKEGLISFYAHMKEFVDPTKKIIRILDNNLLAYKGWRDLFTEIEDSKKIIKFENFDFRLLTEEMAERITKISVKGELIFALDSPKDLPLYEKKIWIIRKYFFPWETKFYVMVGYDTTIEEDIARIKFLWSNKILPYVTRHENYKNSEHVLFLKDLCAWCNQPWFVKKGDFRHFMNVRFKPGHPRIEKESKLFEELWNKY